MKYKQIDLRKLLPVMVAVTLILSFNTQCKQPEKVVFKPTFESLKQYQCPDWFRDAKFGIWSHWGPQSVPMYGDWYARFMYVPGQNRGQYDQHLRTYGHPSEYGFKDIIPLWKAEKFDPDRLMSLYKAAGAKYFVSMAVHHDNFDLWNSKHHKWNAVQMGPKRDIVGDWQKAAQKYGLKFGVSEHLGASYTWFQSSHGSDKKGPLAGVPYDGANPKWQDLYHNKADSSDNDWYTKNEEFQKIWLERITDLVDQYHPDLLYTDGALPFGEIGRKMLAHYYNSKMEFDGGELEAVYTLKNFNDIKEGHGEYVEGIGVQDIERGGLESKNKAPWQTDTSIGDWYYNVNWKTKDNGTMYRGAKWVIQTLVDVVSKNGNMLLNVIQHPDGSIDPEVEQLLEEIADWMKINGDGIFATRPWIIFGEGSERTVSGHFKEDFQYSAKDIRFTQSKDHKDLYAIAMNWPEDGKLIIKSLAKTDDKQVNTIEKVQLLGYDGTISYEQSVDGLMVKLPDQPLSNIACTLKINGQNLQPVGVGEVAN